MHFKQHPFAQMRKNLSPGAFPLDLFRFEKYTFLTGSGRSSLSFSTRLRVLRLAIELDQRPLITTRVGGVSHHPDIAGNRCDPMKLVVLRPRIGAGYQAPTRAVPMLDQRGIKPT